MTQNSQAQLFEDEQADTPVSRSVRRMRVLVPFPVDKAYDYGVPDGMDVGVGDYVRVPLGQREVVGVVWANAEGKAPKNLKDMIARYDVAPMPAAHIKFLDWVAGYTLAPKGAVLKMSLRLKKMTV